MSYHVLQDRKACEISSGEPFKFACCDCGLVHWIVLVSTDESTIGLAVERNPRATAARRREMRKWGELKNG